MFDEYRRILIALRTDLEIWEVIDQKMLEEIDFQVQLNDGFIHDTTMSENRLDHRIVDKKRRLVLLVTMPKPKDLQVSSHNPRKTTNENYDHVQRSWRQVNQTIKHFSKLEANRRQSQLYAATLYHSCNRQVNHCIFPLCLMANVP